MLQLYKDELMSTTNQKNFYSFEANAITGEPISMNNYKNHVVLVVNTASECGFTPQLEGLQNLYTELKNEDFVVLGFPCNQFGGQEPGNEEDIQKGCMVNYGVEFPMFEKINVNGSNAHPLFTWLKSEKKGLLGGRIKWNFTKFLIDSKGKVVGRYGPQTKPESIKGDILKII